MTQPYRYQPYTVHCEPVLDEDVLLVRRTTRRAGISTISGKPRMIYDRKRTPFTDDVVLSLARLHREERIDAESLPTHDAATEETINGETRTHATSVVTSCEATTGES
jgi:hypothetical protein